MLPYRGRKIAGGTTETASPRETSQTAVWHARTLVHTDKVYSTDPRLTSTTNKQQAVFLARGPQDQGYRTVVKIGAPWEGGFKPQWIYRPMTRCMRTTSLAKLYQAAGFRSLTSRRPSTVATPFLTSSTDPRS
ncbi:hypothetical protein Trydic_g15774 [Trypoxylus dichotomus]